MKKILIVLVSLLLFGCVEEKKETVTSENNLNLEMTIFKIGKADSILITVGEKHILIDTGEDEDGDEVLEYLTEHGIETIDYLILTHFDKDHIGGANTILNNSNVLQVIAPNYTKNSRQYNEYTAALIKNDISATILNAKLSVILGSAKMTISPAEKRSYKQDNDYSLVVSIEHGYNSFLFAGDAEEVRLAELIEQGNLAYTFLKVPHHGRFNNKSTEFIQEVRPKYAVITSSDKNPEDDKIMDVLESVGAAVYTTRNGNISVVSDGKTIAIQQ
ncbi:MBL fold metallo-hydrolase [Psychrobacillus sp.]|uniref:ComEC/Rec2 family competence protein n=1 Tax=Psychrobacillus sp. TaxID=1871623 RepID=UPI0028BE5F71|nr:MBL fold metallo-hydrolase [Psychrobacillus sp.]